MDKVNEQENLNIEDLDSYKIQLIDLKEKLNQYSKIKNVVNISYIVCLINFAIHLNSNYDTNRYITGICLMIVLFSKLYVDGQYDLEKDKIDNMEEKILTLKQM